MTFSWIPKPCTRGMLSMALAAALSSGCSATLESELPEAQANEIVVALDRHGIRAVKESDRTAGRAPTYSVRVAADDIAASLSILEAEHLPRRAMPGLADVFDGASLVPTRTEESARLRAALAGELEETIQSMDGVLTAHVHIALATNEPRLLDEPSARPRASVLVRHRGSEPSYDQASIARLVAGAIAGMDPSDVAIVGVPTDPPQQNAPRLVSVGPIAVTQSSAGSLKLVLGALLGTNLVLAILLAITIRRRPRLEADSKVR